LIRDTGSILLDMNPDRRMADNLRQAIEGGGAELADLHLWRLGPGHLGAIMCIGTRGALLMTERLTAQVEACRRLAWHARSNRITGFSVARSQGLFYAAEP